MTSPKMNWGRITIAVGVAVVLDLGLTTLGWWISCGQAADYPAWLEAVSTALALVAAAIAAVFAAGALQREQNRDLERDRAQQRAQADLVSIWSYRTNHIGVRNGSAAPIYDVVVGIHFDPAPDFSVEWAVGTIAPDQARQPIDVPAEAANAWDAHDNEHAGLSIQFTDAGGNRWERTRLGRLVHRGMVPDQDDHDGVDDQEWYGVPDESN